MPRTPALERVAARFALPAAALLAACSGVASPVPVERVAAERASGVEASPADSAVIAWRREIGPSVFAMPSVAGPVVLAATGHGEVVALSAETGARYWRRRLSGPIRGIVRRGERVYIASDRENGRAVALRLRDGGAVWSRVVGPVRHAPVVVGDTLFFATEHGSVYALAAATGETLWRAQVRGAASAPPVPTLDEVLVATRVDTLFHIARATGATTGRTPLPATVSAAPLAWSGALLLPLQSGGLLAYDPASRAVRWSADLGAPILASPVRSSNGDAYVLTREAELWRVPAGGGEPQRVAGLGGAAVASLTAAGERLVVGRLDGELLVLRPDGTVVWSERLGDSIVAPVAVDGGAIYAPLLRGTITKIEGAR